MRPKRLAIIGLAVVLLILVVYVYVAKPVLVLPDVSVALPPTIPLKSYLQEKNISGLDVRFRTDGKIFATAGGQDLAQVEYTPGTFWTGINLAQKMLVPDSYRKAIPLVLIVYPGLTLDVLNIFSTVYYVLPIEMNVHLTQG